ncbi:hypothetical protein FVR03_04400 [Pontibacter qinzhouensis]|uniref:Cupin domain-containing protein n=1 Tax=Pontibacter qinzhouensis TaxID=2603253 RepID=A0A5C8KBH8_9BACT|nr:hypothetical protein [Pontibacter qinzhouensis]TXK50737.1 hypothetical protein FVR03_04400 [Pontibacter qinzhouensis]
MKKITMVAALLATSLSVSTSAANGQDVPATKNEAQKFSQLLDTNFMRLLEVDLKPGEFATVHGNPEQLAYAATAGTLLVTTPDGNTQLIKVKAGDQLWSGINSYKTVNVGKVEFKAVVYEDKAKTGILQPHSQKLIAFLAE